ncbi:carboxypeptidase-like regulatory domain-containing protein [Pedobacter sp. B4-66]|uniref:carboxypeptidase-like regulatory domain-containing protein n=1 Tax=Pedobacter sp. B4-66 TaxID=2817280 RepID=UPI001BD9433C|nr:carboxypeptidase-like regulatory domain-containing protein [Pedobacter sp. B4-66]
MKKSIILIQFILFYINVNAQETFTITGTVTNAKSEQIEAATIFIDGSQKSTKTDAKGEFKFSGLGPGTYQVVVSMLGYGSIKQNAVVLEKSVVLNFILTEKQIVLDEVIIGNNNQRKNFLKTFTKYFMGESKNAKECKILNTDIIDFSTEKDVLKANSSDFLIVENRKLGYRIKYLLRKFQYNKKVDATIYDGESIFEDIKGSKEEQEIWKANRKMAYEGSLMHYLRALYKNKTQEEGFLTHVIKNPGFPLMINPNPVYTEQLIERVDSNFITFKYKERLYTVYDKKKVSSLKLSNVNWEIIEMDETGSVLQLDAQIDSKGSYAGYKNLLIQGFWGRKRIADQLPLEYNPDI